MERAEASDRMKHGSIVIACIVGGSAAGVGIGLCPQHYGSEWTHPALTIYAFAVAFAMVALLFNEVV